VPWRFPLKLPVVLSLDKEERAALTRDVSPAALPSKWATRLSQGWISIFPCECQVRFWVPRTISGSLSGRVYAAQEPK